MPGASPPPGGERWLRLLPPTRAPSLSRPPRARQRTRKRTPGRYLRGIESGSSSRQPWLRLRSSPASGNVAAHPGRAPRPSQRLASKGPQARPQPRLRRPRRAPSQRRRTRPPLRLPRPPVNPRLLRCERTPASVARLEALAHRRRARASHLPAVCPRFLRRTWTWAFEAQHTSLKSEACRGGEQSHITGGQNHALDCEVGDIGGTGVVSRK
jgi:hypothetical protein